MSDTPLLDLVEGIRARDTARALALLAAAPQLAKASFADNGKFKFPVGAYYYKGDTALHFAARAYDTKVAAALIAAGAQVRARNRRGHEPLHLAAGGEPGSAGWNPDAQAATIHLLLKAGADPNAVDAGGVTPLHKAVRARCGPAVEALLEGGADPRAKSKAGSIPADLTAWTTGRGGSGSPQAKAQLARIVWLFEQRGGTA